MQITFQLGTTYLTIFIAAVISYLSLRILLNLRKLKDNSVENFILIFCSGAIFYALGEVSFFFTSNYSYISVADIFFVIGSVLFIVAFSYKYLELEKKSLSFKEIFAFNSCILVSALILFFLFHKFAFPEIGKIPFIEIFLNFFYPITSVIIFLFALANRIHSNEKGGYSFYIMSSFFFLFIGDMLYSYTSWTNTYGIIGRAHDLVYILGYLFMLFGVLLIYKKLKNSTGKSGK